MKTLTGLKKAVIFVLLAILNSVVYSQSSNEELMAKKDTSNNILIKHTLSAGGGEMSGNTYVVVSSIGQIDAGHVTSGGGHQFIGGFLADPHSNELFKNGFE